MKGYRRFVFLAVRVILTIQATLRIRKNRAIHTGSKEKRKTVRLMNGFSVFPLRLKAGRQASAVGALRIASHGLPRDGRKTGPWVSRLPH